MHFTDRRWMMPQILERKETIFRKKLSKLLRKAWRKNGPTLLIYIVSALGALSKSFFDAAVSGNEFSVSAGTVLFAFVVSAVVFPLVFQAAKKAHGGMEEAPLLVYFAAYQNGFFWQSLLTQIMVA